MDTLNNLALGFGVALTLQNLLYCLAGVTLGTMIGVLPGVGPMVTISLLLPITFGMPPEGALIMLAGIYYGAQYGGSTTAILVNVPGETSSVVTCLDGYKMAQQGRAGAALAIAAIASLFAGIVGTALVALFGPLIAEIAIRFGSAEFFSLLLLALCSTAIMVKGSPLKGLSMALLGVLIGLAGTDVNSGEVRFAFGVRRLEDGVDLLIIAMGLFAFTEIVTNLASPERAPGGALKVSGLMPTRADLRRAWPAILRGTGIGALLGILPGAGASVSAFTAYLFEKQVSKTPERFGTGMIEGVASPEAANNAAVQTSFIPTLTLGVPGSAVMALLLGALLIQGITPGPQVLTKYPELFWGLIASMVIGNIVLVILNLPLVGLWVRMLRVPYRWLFPGILVFGCFGIYAANNNYMDILLTAGFALLGWVFMKLDCEPMPLVLGFVLGPLFEENMRRAMVISHGDPTIFVTQPISAAFVAITIAMFGLMLFSSFRRPPVRVLAETE